MPYCDHYAGSEKLMRKSLALQAELGPVFEVTLDCEDSAAVGREAELVAAILGDEANRFGRAGMCIHDCSHPHRRDDVRIEGTRRELGITGPISADVLRGQFKKQ